MDPISIYYFSEELQKEAVLGAAVKGIRAASGQAGGWAKGTALPWAKKFVKEEFETGLRQAVQIPWEVAKNPYKAVKSGIQAMKADPSMMDYLVVPGIGLDAYSELTNKKTIGGRDRGLGERAGGALAGTLTGIAGLRAGVIGGLGSYLIGSGAGSLAGRAADTATRAFRKKKPLSALSQQASQVPTTIIEEASERLGQKKLKAQKNLQTAQQYLLKTAALREEMSILLLRKGK